MEGKNETKSSYNAIPKEIDMLLDPKDYLKLAENNKKIQDRMASEDSAVTELMEVVAADINCGSSNGVRATLFHLKEGEMHEIFLSEDSKRRVKIRTTAYFKNAGYNIRFAPGDDYAYSISVVEEDNKNKNTVPNESATEQKWSSHKFSHPFKN
jgi:hypothetical protein